MKIYGSLTRLVSLIFRKNSNNITFQPNTGTYTGTTTISLPPTLSGSATLVDETSAQAISGKTQLDVDNIRLDGNTISSTNSGGNIVLDPNGNGEVQIPDNASFRLLDADNSNSTAIKAASVTTADVVYSLPAAGPSVNGQVLSSTTAGIMSWATALSNPMTTLGDIIYEDSTPAPARLAGNTTTTKKFLTQTGNGSVSAAPGWNTIVGADVPIVVPGTSAGVVSSSGVPGNTTGSSISAGYIGETITSTLTFASQTSMNTATAKTITSISVTAGIWMFSGAVHFENSGNTTLFYGTISVTNNAIPGTNALGNPNASGEFRAQLQVPSGAYNEWTVSIPAYKFTVTSTTTFYLVGQTSFSTGVSNANGFIQAVRIG